VTKREIVETLRSMAENYEALPRIVAETRLRELAYEVESLPEPEEGPSPKLGAWRPGTSVLTYAQGDCLISLKAAIEAGARIVIEPATPETE
jgi:hypothetical protein